MKWRLPKPKNISRTGGVLLLLVMLHGVVVCPPSLQAESISSSSVSKGVRESVRLETGWLFQQRDVLGAEKPGFDAAGWQNVSLPHCWGWQEAQQGDTNYYRGPGWYRRELTISPEHGKRYFLRFEAASLVTDVFLNGIPLGEHRGGFGAFCFEITTNLSASGTNLLAVRVSNERFPDVAPLAGDFNVYGGLYRPVQLLKTEAACFTLTDHGSPGVKWLQKIVSATQAVLEVKTVISVGQGPLQKHEGTLRGTEYKVTARVLDANGKPVAGTVQQVNLSSDATAPVEIRVVVDRPHLWDGRADPYMYRAVVDLWSGNAMVDMVEQPLGLRFYRIDPEQGFLLNGHPYHLHGVNRHQDFQDKGWAITEAEIDGDVALLKEIGATVVRCCHYQHSDYFYSLCDRAGILVWAELPQVNIVRDNPVFLATSSSQLRDLIRQSLNHPSIFTWSLFNEVGRGSDDPHANIAALHSLAHAEDPTRPTVAAACVQKKEWADLYRTMDTLGWNTYPGWYAGAPTNMARFVDRQRDSSRQGGIAISEYGAGANIAQHEANPRHPKTTGQWHPEEWQNVVHETTWAQLKTRPFVWGTFVWNLFDFCVAGRHEGDATARNDKGLITFDRQTKKDAFYFYKANWSDEPVLYITSRRFTERTNAVTNVKAYSNAKAVTLFVNGASLGARDNDGNAVFLWENVNLSAVENQIEVRAERNGCSLKDSCIWWRK